MNALRWLYRLAGTAALLTLTLALAPPAHANWNPFPGGLQVSSSVEGPHSCPDGNGGTWVAYFGAPFGPPDNRLYAVHLRFDGAFLASVQLATLAGPTQLAIVPDGSGGCIVAYLSSAAPANLVAQRLDLNASPVWTSTVDNLGTATSVQATADDSGGMIVLWSDTRGGTSTFVQRLTSGGSALWATNGKSLGAIRPSFVPSAGASNAITSICTDGVGGAFIAFRPSSTTDLLLQHVDGSGNLALGGGVDLSHTDLGSLSGAGTIVSDAAHGAWISYLLGTGLVVEHAPSTVNTSSVLNPVAVPSLYAPDTNPDPFPSLIANASGLFLAIGIVNGSAHGVLVQHVTNAMSFDWDNGFVQGRTTPFISTGSTIQPMLTWGGVSFPNNVVVSWPDVSTDSLRAQGFDATGHPAFLQTGVALGDNGWLVGAVPGAFVPSATQLWVNAGGALEGQNVSLSDVDVTVTQPGWAGPLVPRADSLGVSPGLVGATVLLEGQPFWLNYSFSQPLPNTIPPVALRVYADGEEFVDASKPLWTDMVHNVPNGFTTGDYMRFNVEMSAMPGGPHTLTIYAASNVGVDNQLDEALEFNNSWSHQWVWEPSWILAGPLFNTFPKPLGKFPIPNGIGHKFLSPSKPPNPNAWVASCAARRGPTYGPAGQVLGYGDSYGLETFDLPVGAGEFTHMIGASHQGFNGTNFTVALAPAAPDSIYPLVVRDSVQDSNPDSCWFDLQFADDRYGPAAGSTWTDQAMAPGELTDVYLLQASARQSLKLSLRRHEVVAGPQSALAFEVFPPESAAVFSRGGGMASHTVSADVETLSFVATSTGPYVVVVFRQDGSAAGGAMTYDFESSSVATLDAPGSGPAVRLSFAGAEPNPARGGADLSYTLPAAGPASLALYDLGGRQVRVLASGDAAPGGHRVHWDGTGADGARVRAGLYFARLSYGGHTLVRRLTVIE